MPLGLIRNYRCFNVNTAGSDSAPCTANRQVQRHATQAVGSATTSYRILRLAGIGSISTFPLQQRFELRKNFFTAPSD